MFESVDVCRRLWKRMVLFQVWSHMEAPLLLCEEGVTGNMPYSCWRVHKIKRYGSFLGDWDPDSVSIFFHSKLIREGKTETFTATLRLLMGCLYSWMNEAVMILNATCWCTMGSNHKAFSNLRSYSWWTKMWLTSNLKIFPNWCKVSAINNIKPCDLKLEIVGFFSHPKQVVT